MEQFEIIWAEEALENLDAIARSIGKHWSRTEVDQYYQQVREEEQILSIFSHDQFRQAVAANHRK